MKHRLLIALFAILAVSAHAEDELEVEVEKSPATLPAQELTPQIVYQILLAEIAGSRGQIGLAADAYGDLARTTRDPRIARRAAEAALIAGRYEQALAGGKLWAELDPASPQARQMIGGLLAAMNRSDDLTAYLSQQLAAAGTDVGPQLMQLNRALARFSDKEAMQRLVEKVTEPYASMAEAHFARAQAAHAAGKKEIALAEIDRALVLRPDWEYAALVRAQLMPTGADATKALGDFVAANPKAHDARLAYARNLVTDHRFSEARQEFRTLLTGNPDATEIIYAVAVLSVQLNDYDEAETQFKRLVDLNYSEINSARLYLGQIAEERKRWGDAFKWYEQVTAGGQYLGARMRIAHVLAVQGKLPEARKVLQETAATNSVERSQLVIAEAQLLREADRYEEAYTVLADGLALHPDEPDLLYETALSAEKVGKIDVVERDLRRLIELKPDHAHAYNALGYSLADRNERLDEAQQLIDKALQLAPEDPFILDSKGWVLFKRGDTNTALDVLKKAFALRADPEIAAHIGEVLWSMGKQDEARKTWNEAAKTNPANEALVETIKKHSKP
jgi:tetratricopeptide (TPR) repeat protein